MMKNPLLTICVLTHNAEKFLAKTLNSILEQTYPNFEILASDNYSNDRTEEIIRNFRKQSRKIIFRENPKPQSSDKDYIGCYYNYNSCIKSDLIRGEFVAFCHDDDVYEKDFAKKGVEFLIQNPEVAAVFTTVNMINQEDKKIGQLGLPKELKKKNVYNFKQIFKALLNNGNTFLQTPTFITRKGVFEKVGLFNEEKFRTSADLDIWLRILENYSIAILDKPLVSWRVGGGGKDYQHLCTERSDFFKVMDYYLDSKNYRQKVEKKFLRQYKYQKRFNDTLRVMNFLIKGEKEKARELLKSPFPYSRFLAFFENLSIKKIKGALLRTILKLGIFLGLGKPLAQFLYKLRYK